MGLNLKDTQGGTFEPIPTGRYNVKISNAEAAKTQERKDIIKITYTVTDGAMEKKKFFDQAVITPNSLWKVKTLLTLAGSDLAEGANVELDDIVEALKDAQLSVHVEVSKNEDGNPRYNCSGWQKPSTSPVKVARPAEKKVNVLG